MGDFRTTTGEDMPLTQKEKRVSMLRRMLIAVAIVAAVVLAGVFIKINRYTLASGYVTSMHYAEVRPPVTGIVSNILASSGDHVKKGDVLVEFNSDEEQALLAETKARVSKLETEMERRKAEMNIDLERRTVELEEQKRNHKDQLEIADLQLKNAMSKLKLTTELVAQGLKAASYLEDDQLSEQLAKVQLNSLKSKDFKIYEELIVRDREKYDQEIAALSKELGALEDSVRRVEARLETRRVRAPIDGTLVRYEFVIGELLEPSHVIYEIFGDGAPVLKLRVNEKYATRVCSGQKYRARLSSYMGLSRVYFRGEISAMRNVIQSQGSDKYRVAYCTFDPGERDIPPGTTAEARIYYGRSCFWFYLLNLDL